MPSALVPLANITLASNTTTVSWSSISQSYRDLILVINGMAATATAEDINLRFNGDTGTNYSYVYLRGNGSAASSSNQNSISAAPVSDRLIKNTNRATVIVHIMDYSATDKHKTVLSRADEAGTSTNAYVNRWANTAAITSMTVFNGWGTNNYATGMTMALYGVSA